MLIKLWELFYTFFKIGLFTIGGGYAMIPMIKTEVINKGWLTETELLNFMAISESTPGPFAINMATFVGNNLFDGPMRIVGGIVATLAVVLPSVIIILIVARCYLAFMKNKYVNYVMNALKSIVIGLLLGVVINLFYEGLLPEGFDNLGGFDWRALIIMVVVGAILFIKKKPNVILLILLSGALGIVLYGFI